MVNSKLYLEHHHQQLLLADRSLCHSLRIDLDEASVIYNPQGIREKFKFVRAL